MYVVPLSGCFVPASGIVSFWFCPSSVRKCQAFNFTCLLSHPSFSRGTVEGIVNSRGLSLLLFWGSSPVALAPPLCILSFRAPSCLTCSFPVVPVWGSLPSLFARGVSICYRLTLSGTVFALLCSLCRLILWVIVALLLRSAPT